MCRDGLHGGPVLPPRVSGEAIRPTIAGLRPTFRQGQNAHEKGNLPSADLRPRDAVHPDFPEAEFQRALRDPLTGRRRKARFGTLPSCARIGPAGVVGLASRPELAGRAEPATMALKLDQRSYRR
jgi:hypothetical protein